MFNPHTKFDVSTIICNEEMTDNARCKNSCFEPPLGGLSGNAQVLSSSTLFLYNVVQRHQITIFHYCGAICLTLITFILQYTCNCGSLVLHTSAFILFLIVCGFPLIILLQHVDMKGLNLSRCHFDLVVNVTTFADHRKWTSPR